MANRLKARVKSLRRAKKRYDHICLVRRIKRADRIEGHVVGIGRRWALFAVATDGSPDGYVVVRIQDIKRIYWASGRRFTRRSLEAQGAWPPVAPSQPVDLDHGVRQLVNSVSAVAALVTIHPELDRTDVCYIGRPAGWGRRKLRLHEVSPEGRWENSAEKHRIEGITRVDFCRVYETNLATVAGKQPRPK